MENQQNTEKMFDVNVLSGLWKNNDSITTEVKSEVEKKQLEQGNEQKNDNELNNVEIGKPNKIENIVVKNESNFNIVEVVKENIENEAIVNPIKDEHIQRSVEIMDESKASGFNSKDRLNELIQNIQSSAIGKIDNSKNKLIKKEIKFDFLEEEDDPLTKPVKKLDQQISKPSLITSNKANTKANEISEEDELFTKNLRKNEKKYNNDLKNNSLFEQKLIQTLNQDENSSIVQRNIITQRDNQIQYEELLINKFDTKNNKLKKKPTLNRNLLGKLTNFSKSEDQNVKFNLETIKSVNTNQSTQMIEYQEQEKQDTLQINKYDDEKDKEIGKLSNEALTSANQNINDSNVNDPIKELQSKIFSNLKSQNDIEKKAPTKKISIAFDDEDD
jgi:hypothetical protein